jgi:lipoprotein-releasing system permease protein
VLFRSLLDRKSGVSFLDIFIAADADPEEVRKSISKILGPDVLIKNEYQLHEDLFKVMEIEKLFVFLALGFIILISTFNLFVSSSMMVLNKQKDFTILSALGMEKSMFASIVRTNGLLLTLLGLIPGLIMAILIIFTLRST